MFQLIYARGMFRLQAMPRLPLELFQFIYVRGMFLLSDWTYLSLQVFQFIYVRGMFLRWFCGGFNSYMCGECFSVGSVVVSTHICAGNVSFRIRYRTMEHALVSTHICAGGMFQYRPGTLAYGHKFQLIYVRGMFPNRNLPLTGI